MNANQKKRQLNKPFWEDGVLHFSMHDLAVLFFAAIFFLPDYFGIRIGVVLNGQRLAVAIALIWIFFSSKRRKQLLHLVFSNRDIWLILLYLFVCFYTMVFRTNLGTLMNPLLDMIAVYFLTVYFLRYECSIEQVLRIIITCAWILSVLAFVEMLTKTNLFSYLITIKGMGGGGLFRDGVYRVGGNCAHPLGYGLYLLLLFPLSCYNYRLNRLDIMNRPVLELLLLVNAYGTGSRSTLGLILLECVLIVCAGNWENLKKAVVISAPLFCMGVVLYLLFYETAPVQALSVRVLTTIDGALGTNLARKLLNYNSLILDGSTDYRKYLVKIFFLDWLNPVIGQGNGFSFSAMIEGQAVISIDNFYVYTYIAYAYPGLISFLLLCLSQLRYAVKGILYRQNAFYKALLIGVAVYFLNLWYVEALGTLDYVFVLFGILYAQSHRNGNHPATEENGGMS